MSKCLRKAGRNGKTALALPTIPSTISALLPNSYSRTMRLGLYGGTFDPIHHGHLILAREAIETLDLEQLVFIPAALSPHKLTTAPVPGALRRDMVAAAIAGEPRFTLDDSEIRRGGHSFTIDTVEHLRALHPGAELYYFIGEDNVAALHTWRRIDELRQLVRFVVFGRGDDSTPGEFPRLSRRIDISATEIRSRVARGRSIRYLVPESVRALIEQHHLYQDPFHQS
jgi:nicotinate-nucleotide adenylyltransferase